MYVQNVPVCTCTTPAHVETHARVVPVHTGRFECTHAGRVEHTHGRGVGRGGEGQRDTHTNTNTHTHQHTRHAGAREARRLLSLSSSCEHPLFLFSTTMTMITGSLVVRGMWVQCLCVTCCCLMLCVMCVVVGLCCADIQIRHGYLDESHGFSCRSPALVLNFSPL